MDKDKMRRGFYAIAGAYLLYTAWQLFQGLDEMEANQTIMALFAVAFAAAGAALIGFCVWSMRKEDSQESHAENSPEAGSEAEEVSSPEAGAEPEEVSGLEDETGAVDASRLEDGAEPADASDQE
ncbi:MAG: hypothetical protein LUI07_07520 [Lachnospiraceae bacterium]|nr:hypothetical protein [Lachnospiraceae bacterium]